MITKDAKLELVTSNTLCPINLNYSSNYITKTIAYIFVNTACKDIPCNNAAVKAKKANELFSTVLNFNEVKIYKNLSKKDVIDKLIDLKNIAKQFEEENENKN